MPSDTTHTGEQDASTTTDSTPQQQTLVAPPMFQHYTGPDPKSIVFIESQHMPADAPTTQGYDFAQHGIDYQKIFESMKYTGFQATQFGLAVETINNMLRWRLSDEPLDEGESEDDFPVKRNKVKCTIFLGYTSNMISSGVREVIRYLAQHKMIDCIVTSAGGVEEDIMKCFSPHYMGAFDHSGQDLRLRGLNRIGNLIVPNTNYIAFEEFINPLLDAMLDEQIHNKTAWTPSKIIHRLGKEIDDPSSVYYWCYKNNIPVFCPALTDGSLGDMIYFHSEQHRKEHLRVDIVEDIRKLNNIALLADKSGMIILGGGTVKHHICNANLMRNGADYSVYINTGVEHDGSDSGASPDEAISWGKIKINAKPVKLWAEASMVFPLIVAQTFAQHHDNSPTFTTLPPQPLPPPVLSSMKLKKVVKHDEQKEGHHDLA